MIELQKEFDYLFEIIRGDLYLGSNIEGISFILKLIFYRLMTVCNNNIKQTWGRMVECERESNRVDLYQLVGMIQEDINVFINEFNGLSRSRETKLSNLRPQTVDTVFEIIRFLDKLKIEEVSNDIKVLAEIFHMLVLRLLPLGKQRGYLESYTDENISKIISSIVKIEQGDSIFDPFIGTGGLIYTTIKNLDYSNLNIVGQDIDPEILGICSMLINLMGISNLALNIGDSIYDSNHDIQEYEGRFDKVITHIPYKPYKPYNLMLNFSYSSYSNNSYLSEYDVHYLKNSNYFTIIKIINMLNSKGQAYIVAPNNILYSGGKDKEIRRQIIGDDLIESVIEFSDYGIYNGNIKPVILVLNKKKEYYKKNKIQLMSVQDDNIETLIGVYREYTDSYYSRIISLEKIKSRGYNLNFTHYDPIYDEVKQMLVQNIGVSLRNSVEVVKPIIRKISVNKEINSNIYIPIIKQSNLRRDIDNVFLEFKNTNDFDYITEIGRDRILDRKAIIIAIQGKDLKPTIFDPHMSKIKRVILASNCLALIPSDSSVDPINIDFLYYQLYNPRVIRQIDGYKRGTIMKRITYDDLLDVVISKPEYDKQLLIIKDQQEPLKELEKYKKLYEELSYKLEVDKIEAENRVVNMLIHNVGKHISVIGHDISIIKKVLVDHNLLDYIFENEQIEKYNLSIEVRNKLVKKKELATVGEVFQRTIDRLDLIEKTFTDTQKTVNLNLGTQDFEKINVKEFIINIKHDREVNQPLDYDFVVEGDDVVLDINIQSFKEMIHLLINNAEEHAFIKACNTNNLKYYIKFIILKLKDRITIQYINNGNKFNMKKQDFILAGRKSKNSKGSGLGGAYLNRVIISHNGSFEILSVEEGTKFIFNFPIER